jgi:hypothetical protein
VYAFPVGGKPVSYHRTHSGYKATDIFAKCGSPVVAVTDGVVLEVSRVDRFDPARPDNALKGGLFVSLPSPAHGGEIPKCRWQTLLAFPVWPTLPISWPPRTRTPLSMPSASATKCAP